MLALASAIAPLLAEPAPVVHSRLELNHGDLGGVVSEALYSHNSGERLVLVVDQFEEVLTACPDGTARRRFIRALVVGPCSLASRPVVTVVTVERTTTPAASSMPSWPDCSDTARCSRRP